MLNKIKIPNKKNELLDVWIEGNTKATTTIVLVHGLGIGKHGDYFDTVSKVLSKNYRIVRFDFSGCGESEGKMEEKNLKKWSEDLAEIIYYVKNTFKGEIYIIAHSMGTFTTTLLKKYDFNKIVLTGTPNSNTNYIIKFISENIKKRKEGKINYSGISIFPRSFGEVQKLGPSFWKILRHYNPIKMIHRLVKSKNTLMIHMKQDEVINGKYLEEYSNIKNLKIEWLNGNHSFTNLEDRNKLIERIICFFEE